MCLMTNRFQPEKGFEGADQSQPRDGPVQFQKDVEEDPFGLNKFLTEAKKGKRQAEEDNRFFETFTVVLSSYLIILCTGKEARNLDIECNHNTEMYKIVYVHIK